MIANVAIKTIFFKLFFKNILKKLRNSGEAEFEMRERNRDRGGGGGGGGRQTNRDRERSLCDRHITYFGIKQRLPK